MVKLPWKCLSPLRSLGRWRRTLPTPGCSTTSSLACRARRAWVEATTSLEGREGRPGRSSSVSDSVGLSSSWWWWW